MCSDSVPLPKHKEKTCSASEEMGKVSPLSIHVGQAEVWRHPRPNPASLHIHSWISHAGATGKLDSLRHRCKKKVYRRPKASPSFAKGKAIFSRVTLQELIFFSSVMLPELPRTRDFCTQPVCCRGAPTHCHRATADCPCPLACPPLQSQQNYLDK